MRSFFYFALIALVALTTTSSQAFFRYADISIKNEMQYPAWVDVSSTVGKVDTWHIMRHICMRRNASTEIRVPFHLDQGNEIRVRAFVKLHGCESGTHKELSAEHALSVNGQKFQAVIYEKVPNHFGLALSPQ